MGRLPVVEARWERAGFELYPRVCDVNWTFVFGGIVYRASYWSSFWGFFLGGRWERLYLLGLVVLGGGGADFGWDVCGMWHECFSLEISLEINLLESFSGEGLF